MALLLRESFRVQRSCRHVCYNVPPPKTAPQVAAVAFVIPDHLVDAFMAQLDARCHFSQPLMCFSRVAAHFSRNLAWISQRMGTVSLRGLLRIACRA